MPDLLFQDTTEQKQAVYAGQPIRVELGEIQLNGATEQEVEVPIQNLHQAGNVQIIAECSLDDTGAASTEVQFKYAPRVQRLDGTFSKSVQDAVTIGTLKSNLSATTQEPEILDIPLHVRDNGSSHNCMTPFGCYIYAFGEAASDAKLQLSALVF